MSGRGLRHLAWMMVCAAMLARGTGCRGDDDVARLKRQTREFEWASLNTGSNAEQQANRWATKLRGDGSWEDIDYKDQARGFWKTATHLKRTLAMAAIYSQGTATGRSEGALKAATLSASHYWFSHDFQNPNWWQNEIGVPQDVVLILLLMEDGMSPEDRAAGLKIAARATISMTGQNRVWKAGIVFRRALVEGDIALARQARDTIMEEVKVSAGEGLQGDDSFHQHGPQQQMGNYGLAFASDMSAWAWIWRATELAVPKDKMTLLRGYVLRGEAIITVNQALDISGCDRQLFQSATKGRGHSVLAVLGRMEEVDPEHAQEYGAAARQDSQPVGSGLTMNKDFFRSDFMVHRRPGFYVSVKLCSNRVIGEELVNGENLSGRYLADGATYLYQTNTEYADIFPVWDWRRVPGVTCETTGTTLAPAGKMATDFAGGVSDGTYGAAGLDYHRDGVTGKKAWFFLDDGVVCLGAGISGTTGPVRTSVDQRLADGATLTPEGPLAAGMRLCKGATWLLQGKTGYVFAHPQDVWAGTQTQQGTWKNVYSAGPSGEVARPVFSVWIEQTPTVGSYAYTMLPAATAERLQAYAAKPGAEILSNTPEAQAVRDEAAGVTEIVFYKPARLDAGKLSIATSGPCAVVIRKSGIYLSDPTQKELAVTLIINGEPLPVNLPQGDLAGSTVKAGPP